MLRQWAKEMQGYGTPAKVSLFQSQKPLYIVWRLFGI
jgi:hypothetical protein